MECFTDSICPQEDRLLEPHLVWGKWLRMASK